MQDVKLYLKKFNTFKNTNTEIAGVVSSAINSVCGFCVTRKNIQINKRYIFIKTTPHKRAVIFFKKGDIVRVVESILSGININLR